MITSIRFISDHSDILGVWRNKFQYLDGTDFQSTSLRNVQADDRFVCLLMPATVVFSRLGQPPVVGRSEVFTASANPRLRTGGFRYIATTVLLPGRLRLASNESGERSWNFEPRSPITREKEVRKLFDSLLLATDEFNEVYNNVITGLVIDLDVVNSSNQSARGDAEAALQAVQRHRAIRNFSDSFNDVADHGRTLSDPFEAIAASYKPYAKSRNYLMERVNQFYLTSSAINEAGQLSITRGEVIDAAISGDIVERSGSDFPLSVRLTIIGPTKIPGRRLEIRCVLDKKRGRLTIQRLRIKGTS